MIGNDNHVIMWTIKVSTDDHLYIQYIMWSNSIHTYNTNIGLRIPKD